MKLIWRTTWALSLVSCQQADVHPLVGTWVNAERSGPTSTYLTLRDDLTFSMGDLDNDQRHTGATGTWQVRGETLCLRVVTSETDKVREGHIFEWTYRLLGDTRCEFIDPKAGESVVFETAR